MDGYYLYGIVGFPPPLPRRIRGLGGDSVSLVPHAGLAAVVSRSGLSSWPLDAEHLTRHEAVVEEVMACRPVLPVRFNSLLRDEGTVRMLLGERAPAFRSALERVSGRVEMGLRVLWQPPEDAEAAGEEEIGGGPGTGYLYRRLGEERRQVRLRRAGERLIQALQAPFRSLAVESRLRRFMTERLLLSGAYLVERERVDAFREGVARARAGFPGLSFLLTGPWPPYHFVDGAPR
ncbi:MAG: GvpL/GvpF family gas vesicle protein [Candidatus Rokubacteria bacterium]|nr:GvpL/GvpF family gas vesicle protein [Candidatus Rokubacteria bacterium]